MKPEQQVEAQDHHSKSGHDASHAFHKELHKEHSTTTQADRSPATEKHTGEHLDMGNIWDNTTHAVQHGAQEAGKAAGQASAAADQVYNQAWDAMDKNQIGHIITHDICNDNRTSGKLLAVGAAIALAPIAFEAGTVGATVAGTTGMGLAITGLMNGQIHGKDH